ncbi:hypothetical protein Vadar_010518 [Vaccinium darrowii]|uniref:Uncharacterized protein n=1 Tax=Vaccinium darrowii TaxID=229202 RepID=A0ACB7WZN0_9ERIC|nr:hypothetical protein Vadar_010518 [Vaccinium darrowii]
MKGNEGSNSDVISELPSHLTENILEILPLRDAVRTSVLSSKWRNNWVTLPQLPREEIDSEWVKFFHSLPAIEDMHLDMPFLESFAAGNVPKRLPNTLNQLKVLALSDVCYANLDHVSWALCLLRSSPNLHKLKSIPWPKGTEAAGAMDLFPNGFFKELFLRKADVFNGSVLWVLHQRTGDPAFFRGLEEDMKPMCGIRDLTVPSSYK